MKILEKLFGETASGIANIVDRFVQTKEEKHEANKEIQKLFQNFYHLHSKDPQFRKVCLKVV